MNRDARTFVAGGDTLIGAAVLDRLRERGFGNLVGVGPDEPDPTDAEYGRTHEPADRGADQPQHPLFLGP